MHIASTTALTSHSAYHAATTATAPSWQGRTPKDSMPPRRRQAAGRQRLGWYCLGLLLTACIDTAPADSGTIAPIKSTGTRVTLQVRDARQHPWPPLAMPRRPQLWLHAEPALRPSPDAIWLLSVQPGADLRRDLEGKPLRQAHQALAVPLDHAVHAADLQLQVQGTLAPDQDYTLAVAAWAEDVGEGRIATPLLFPLHTAIDAGGGAIRDSWPADGSAGVPPALPWVAVRFDQAVADTSAPATGWLRWVDEGGEPVHHTARWIDCHRIGWHTGQCLELRPSAPLAPGTHHRLELDEAATDGTGATLSPWQASFITADADAPSDDAIQWQPLDCAPGQRALPIGCLDIDDSSVLLFARPDRPLRLFLTVQSQAHTVVAPRGDIKALVDGLAPEQSYDLRIEARDLLDRAQVWTLPLRTTPKLPPLFITEVGGNPSGAEPQQEYVEVHNAAAVPLPLDGLSLSDSRSGRGDALPAGMTLPARATVLIVPAGFRVADADRPIPAGTWLLRVDSALGSGGIRNSGEALWLLDADGHSLSATPPLPLKTTGSCIEARAPRTRRALPEAFIVRAPEDCTPGTVP